MAKKTTKTETFTIPSEIKKDVRLMKFVKLHGAPAYQKRSDPFRSLVRSIVYQQVSGKAAESILKKFVALYSSFPTPQQILDTPLEKLRSAGLSPQKASYILDLSLKFSDGTITPKKLKKMNNDEVVEHLVRVKGIGVWTAHMFMMTTLKRPDILPTLDLAIKKGFQVVYGLRAMPDHKRMEKLANQWRNHATFASWYLWRASESAKPVRKTQKINFIVR